jgi:hypothetical protein
MKIRAIRVCSPQKNWSGTTLATVYITPMLQAFFRFCTRNHIPYAILSRKFGIVQDTASYSPYPDAEMETDEDLLELLKLQKEQYNDTVFIYWNHRPLTHDKWVKMLNDAGYCVHSINTLQQILAIYLQLQNKELIV